MVVDNIGGLSIEEVEGVLKLLHTMQRYCLNNILFLVPVFFFKFTLKMDMSWSISKVNSKLPRWRRLIVSCCSFKLSLFSYAGIVFKIALLFDRNFVMLKPPELRINFMFSISSMACSSFLTDFRKSST